MLVAIVATVASTKSCATISIFKHTGLDLFGRTLDVYVVRGEETSIFFQNSTVMCSVIPPSVEWDVELEGVSSYSRWHLLNSVLSYIKSARTTPRARRHLRLTRAWTRRLVSGLRPSLIW